MIQKNQDISDQDKQNKVKEFLLYPIKKNREIKTEGKCIYSDKDYKDNFDADMSNIAIEFYKIIYSDDKKKLNMLNEKELFNKQIAGDTMCSFETVANDVAKNIPGMGKTKKQRKGQSHEIWPEYLQKYYEQYHCLANFWILPLWIGRSWPKMPEQHKWCRKSKRGINDYMDNFLLFLKNNYDKFTNQYVQYGDFFGKKFENFCNRHFLDGSYIKNNEIVSFSNIDNLSDRIKIMKKLIEERADCISKSKYCDQLFELYNRYRKKP